MLGLVPLPQDWYNSLDQGPATLGERQGTAGHSPSLTQPPLSTFY